MRWLPISASGNLSGREIKNVEEKGGEGKRFVQSGKYPLMKAITEDDNGLEKREFICTENEKRM